jgi:hypothetical protein
VVLRLPEHGKEKLKEIAKCHFASLTSNEDAMVNVLVKRLVAERDKAEREGRRAPSTAEFIDAVRACRTHQYHHDDGRLDKVLEMLYEKRPGH